LAADDVPAVADVPAAAVAAVVTPEAVPGAVVAPAAVVTAAVEPVAAAVDPFAVAVVAVGAVVVVVLADELHAATTIAPIRAAAIVFCLVCLWCRFTSFGVMAERFTEYLHG